jgi:hypothetical protein
MGNPPAVTFSEVTAQYSEEHRRSGTDDHEEHPGCNSSREVRKEEDSNTGVHQNRQQNPSDASCHVSTSCAVATVDIQSSNDYITAPLVSGPEAAISLSAISALWYWTSYSDEVVFRHIFSVIGILQSHATEAIKRHIGFCRLRRTALSGDDPHSENGTQDGAQILYDRHWPVFATQPRDDLSANQKAGEGTDQGSQHAEYDALDPGSIESCSYDRSNQSGKYKPRGQREWCCSIGRPG